MKTIITYLPSSEAKKFIRFANRCKANVPGFDYKVSNLHNEVFAHPVYVDGIHCKPAKEYHEVYDLTVTMPEENGWRLLATYKDGAFVPADTTHELVYKNEAHGLDYNKCDVCGHRVKNSYVIANVATGEELQVGVECARKFGIAGIEFLSKFTSELYKIYDYSAGCADGLQVWGGKGEGFTAYETSRMMAACKAQYDECPLYKKGYNDKDGIYHASPTVDSIAARMIDESSIDEDYAAKVCEYILSKEARTDFEEDMQALAKSYYAMNSQIVTAFFMVKNYEESKKNPAVESGMQVKVAGEVVEQRTERSIYGTVTTYTVLTSNGVVCKRKGKLPLPEKGGRTYTEFYAIVKDVCHGVVMLGRVTKNAKKGMEVSLL